ncbi:antitoxin VbhA family protein [Corynebacterium flavescens]|uniref:antitoxin VbhA family protein n=1 Tax=Corynebacterium flavescens TaxID=28028 RepID=UPI003FD610A8
MSSQQQRAEWVSQAEHSLYLEGLLVSPEHHSNAESYVAGKISADELVAITRSRFGLN